jgi:hypothetical protein
MDAQGTPVLKMRCNYWEENNDQWEPRRIKSIVDYIPVGQTSAVGLKLSVPNTRNRNPDYPDVNYRHEDEATETSALGKEVLVGGKKVHVGMFTDYAIENANKELLEDDSTKWMIRLMFPAWCWLLKESTYPCMDYPDGLQIVERKHDTGKDDKDNGVQNGLAKDTDMTVIGKEQSK